MILASLTLIAFAAPAPPSAPPVASPFATHLAAPAVLQDKKDPEKAEAWPDAPAKKALTKSIGKLRKAASDEMVRQGFEELAAMGAGAAPTLLVALGKERDADAARRIREALDDVTTAAHTRLLAEHFDAKKEPTKLYALRRVAELGDAGLREDAEARWTELLAMKKDTERKGKKKVTEELERHLAVLTLSTGSPASLEACMGLAGAKAYGKWSGTLNAAARHAGAAGTEVAETLATTLGSETAMRPRLAALRLLTWAGTKDHAKAVAPCLDARENNVKIAAINALRRLVDGDDPIEKLSAFDAIERANKWKARL